MLNLDNSKELETMLRAMNPYDVFAIGCLLTGYSLGTQAKKSPSS